LTRCLSVVAELLVIHSCRDAAITITMNIR